MNINMLTINTKYNNQNFTARKLPKVREALISLEEETALGDRIRAGVLHIQRKVSAQPVEGKAAVASPELKNTASAKAKTDTL